MGRYKRTEIQGTAEARRSTALQKFGDPRCHRKTGLGSTEIQNSTEVQRSRAPQKVRSRVLPKEGSRGFVASSFEEVPNLIFCSSVTFKWDQDPSVLGHLIQPNFCQSTHSKSHVLSLDRSTWNTGTGNSNPSV